MLGCLTGTLIAAVLPMPDFWKGRVRGGEHRPRRATTDLVAAEGSCYMSPLTCCTSMRAR
jgi:hypothetical protein